VGVRSLQLLHKMVNLRAQGSPQNRENTGYKREDYHQKSSRYQVAMVLKKVIIKEETKLGCEKTLCDNEQEKVVSGRVHRTLAAKWVNSVPVAVETQ